MEPNNSPLIVKRPGKPPEVDWGAMQTLKQQLWKQWLEQYVDKTAPSPWFPWLYVDALEDAICQRNRTSLLAMLQGAAPIPEQLLPVLALEMRAATNSKNGRRPIFTTRFEDILRLDHWKKMQFGGLTSGAAVDELVEELNRDGIEVSKRTLERVIQKPRRSDELSSQMQAMLQGVAEVD